VGDPKALGTERRCGRHFLMLVGGAFLLLVLQSSLTSAASTSLSVSALTMTAGHKIDSAHPNHPRSARARRRPAPGISSTVPTRGLSRNQIHTGSITRRQLVERRA
jgi:hypothetical protein